MGKKNNKAKEMTNYKAFMRIILYLVFNKPKFFSNQL